MRTWKLVSAIISILVGAEILREGSMLHSLATAFKGDTTYVSFGILAGVLIIAGGIVMLVARSNEKKKYDKVALACYIAGFILCFMGPKVWKNLFVFSAWPLACAIVAGIDLYKRRGNEDEEEYEEPQIANSYTNNMTMMECPHCDAKITSNSKFCGSCGKELPKCRYCGALTKEGDAFCSNCGKSLNEDVITTDPTEVKEEYAEGERKSGFKKYLPYILGAIALIAICGGIWWFLKNNNTNKPFETSLVSKTDDGHNSDVNNNNPSTMEIIIRRLQGIFDNVMNGRDNYDESYFSSEFNIIYKKVEEIDNRFLENGEQGFWDTGFWDMSQDITDFEITVNDVYNIKDKEALANVTFTVNYYGGTSNTLNEEIKVILEEGKWVLDDLHGYKKKMKDFYEEYKDFQPSTNQNDTDWLQGHWVYEQGSYKGHFIIQGDKIIQYSSMNPERDEATFRIEYGAIRARLIDGMDLVVPIDFANHTIDYGDGCWMHKVYE